MCMLCDACNYRTTEIKCGGEIKEKGTQITIKVNTLEDLNIDLFKSSTCSISIPEVEFE